jgi:tetraprenyl-beta-curcumene synthase
MTGKTSHRLVLAATFAHAAQRYWLSVFPHVNREIRQWRDRAGTIPDQALRQTALAVQETKRGNIDGAAAFAAFTWHAHRPAVIRAQVAFQAIYDYVDTLAEEPHNDPILNGRQLHQALLIALDPSAAHLDYYEHHPHREDAGYLEGIVDACRVALSTLPSYTAVVVSARRLAERIVAYQSLNLTKAQGDSDALAHWASQETPPHTALRWWETAASAGSSLGIFALIAMAARHVVHPWDARAVEDAYFPWIGSLHSLLDSLVDMPEDEAAGQHNLVEHYASPQETATRMHMLAVESIRRTRSLPRSTQHTVILAGMTSFYLTAHEAHLPHARQAKTRILDAIGNLAVPSILVLRIRRATRVSRRVQPTQSPRPPDRDTPI